MFYLVEKKSQSAASLLIKGECTMNDNAFAVTLEKVNPGYEWVSQDEAIKMYAQKLNAKGRRIHVGVNIKVMRDSQYPDLILFYWDKWRHLGQYSNLTRRPTDAWVMKYLAPKLHHNVPLDPETVITFHWVD